MNVSHLLDSHQSYRDDGRVDLEGSPANDAWKRIHKKLSKKFYAADLDLVLTDRHNIIAITDFKEVSTDGENFVGLRFIKVLLYQLFTLLGIPVYIITAKWNKFNQPEFSNISVFRFIDGNPYPNPPEYQLKPCLKNVTLEKYQEWESYLRNNYRELFNNAITRQRP